MTYILQGSRMSQMWNISTLKQIFWRQYELLGGLIAWVYCRSKVRKCIKERGKKESYLGGIEEWTVEVWSSILPVLMFPTSFMRKSIRLLTVGGFFSPVIVLWLLIRCSACRHIAGRSRTSLPLIQLFVNSGSRMIQRLIKWHGKFLVTLHGRQACKNEY